MIEPNRRHRQSVEHSAHRKKRTRCSPRPDVAWLTSSDIHLDDCHDTTSATIKEVIRILGWGVRTTRVPESRMDRHKRMSEVVMNLMRGGILCWHCQAEEALTEMICGSLQGRRRRTPRALQGVDTYDALMKHFDSVSYPRKLKLAGELGLVHANETEVLHELGRLRNAFAHKSQPDIDATTPPQYRGSWLFTGPGLARLSADLEPILAKLTDTQLTLMMARLPRPRAG